MKIVFIRHGEPDYIPCDLRNFIGHGRALAPLSELGILQAEDVSKNDLLKGCSLIVSSPYTRALQTAAIISRNTGLKISVEVDLHEWLPDKTYQYRTSEQSFHLYEDFLNCMGTYPKGEFRRWETIDEIIRRIVPVINKYTDLAYAKIAIVAHGGVIRRFIGSFNVNYCTPYEIEYSKNFKCFQWVD